MSHTKWPFKSGTIRCRATRKRALAFLLSRCAPRRNRGRREMRDSAPGGGTLTFRCAVIACRRRAPLQLLCLNGHCGPVSGVRHTADERHAVVSWARLAVKNAMFRFPLATTRPRAGECGGRDGPARRPIYDAVSNSETLDRVRRRAGAAHIIGRCVTRRFRERARGRRLAPKRPAL